MQTQSGICSERKKCDSQNVIIEISDIGWEGWECSLEKEIIKLRCEGWEDLNESSVRKNVHHHCWCTILQEKEHSTTKALK